MGADTIYWTECTVVDVPADDDWLSARERARLHELTIPKRRRDWRLGRWSAKTAVRAVEVLERRDLDPADIEIGVLPSGAPHAYVGSVDFNISISHCNGIGLCVVSRNEIPLGCDLETIEARDGSFITDYFTADEQARIRKAPNQMCAQRMVSLFWSAKESALKALHLGLRCPLTHLTVSFDSSELFGGSRTHAPFSGWEPMLIRIQNHPMLGGWWSLTPHGILTISAAFGVHAPIRV